MRIRSGPTALLVPAISLLAASLTTADGPAATAGLTAASPAPIGRQVCFEAISGRRYVLYVPADYDPGRSYPLIISSHGTGQNGDTEMDATGPNSCCDRGTPTWPTLAEANDVIVACPDMTGAYGSPGNQLASGQLAQLAADESASLKIVAELQQTYSVDPGRILMTGFSGGGHVAHYVGLRHGGLFRAICARHGNFNVEETPSPLSSDARRMPVYLFTGAADPVYGTAEAVAWYTAQGFTGLETDTFTASPSNEHTTDRHHALAWFVGLSHLGSSPSGHYITYKGQPLLLVGDSGTQVVMQNANIDYRRWIDDCAARGIRAVHVWAFVPPRQKQDGSKIEARYGYVYPGLTPWARKTAGANATDQLKQWDLQSFDEGAGGDPSHYWPRLRDLCGHAASKDMAVGITVFFGWPKHNTASSPDWAYHPLNVVNGGPVTDNGDPVTEVQMIESPGTEVWAQTWSDAWPSRKKAQWIWERFAKKLIDETAGYGNAFFVFMDEHSYSEGNMGNHFRDFFRSRGRMWMDWNARRSTIDWVMTNSFSGDDKNSSAVSGYNGSPSRPYCFLEGEPYQGSAVRTAIWTFTMGGGHFFFHDDERQETVTTGVMGYDPNVAGQDTGAYKRDWLGHASRFFNEQVGHLDALAPHNELSSTGTYCLADPGRQYVVYSKIGSSSDFSLDLNADDGVFDCRLYNPQSGQFNASFQRRGGGVISFTKPDANDWVLHALISPNRPVAVVATTPSPAEGITPLLVSFDGSGSYDGDSYGDPPQIVSYAWDFTDDGTYDASGGAPTANHEYSAAGTYICRLRVTDNEGMTGETMITVKVRNVPGDFDGDQDVDQDDFGHFQACYSGSGAYAGPGCEDAALDGDGDVDEDDFIVFVSCLSGADTPAQHGCAG